LLSHSIQSFLEREVVGQSRAVNTLTRSLTVALSGLDTPEAPIGSYLFVGPSGTGKSHIARMLVRFLGGPAERLVAVDCSQLGGPNELQSLSGLLAPYFRGAAGREEGPAELLRPSILLVENLESAKPVFVRALLAAVEDGRLRLPDGQQGSLAGCLVLLTSSICSAEIYGGDRRDIGFSSGAQDLEEREKARIYQICAAAVEKRWGPRLLGHLDDLIVFHRLRERDLPRILERQLAELNERLASRQIRVELTPSARSYLLARGSGYPRHGAWFLIKSFRRYVLFPIADIVADGAASAAQVQVDLEGGERLRFLVRAVGRDEAAPDGRGGAPIPVEWDGAPVAAR
jgi:ATP-dependent Clp protease ATP-binding subunit ClpC